MGELQGKLRHKIVPWINKRKTFGNFEPPWNVHFLTLILRMAPGLFFRAESQEQVSGVLCVAGLAVGSQCSFKNLVRATMMERFF